MIVTSRGFAVNEAPDRELWDFWGEFDAGRWEPETLEVLDRFLRPASVYIDVGAWIGPTVLFAATRCARVIAIEPDPVAETHLRANVDLNGFGDRVDVLALALDSEAGTTRLHARGDWGSSMSSTIGGHGPSTPVACVTLESIISPLEGIALVKIDIEGAETKVLPPAMEILARRRIPCLVSLHEEWCWPEDVENLRSALGLFDRTTVMTNPAPFPFRTVLGEWNP